MASAEQRQDSKEAGRMTEGIKRDGLVAPGKDVSNFRFLGLWMKKRRDYEKVFVDVIKPR